MAIVREIQFRNVKTKFVLEGVIHDVTKQKLKELENLVETHHAHGVILVYSGSMMPDAETKLDDLCVEVPFRSRLMNMRVDPDVKRLLIALSLCRSGDIDNFDQESMKQIIYEKVTPELDLRRRLDNWYQDNLQSGFILTKRWSSVGIRDYRELVGCAHFYIHAYDILPASFEEVLSHSQSIGLPPYEDIARRGVFVNRSKDLVTNGFLREVSEGTGLYELHPTPTEIYLINLLRRSKDALSLNDFEPLFLDFTGDGIERVIRAFLRILMLKGVVVEAPGGGYRLVDPDTLSEIVSRIYERINKFRNFLATDDVYDGKPKAYLSALKEKKGEIGKIAKSLDELLSEVDYFSNLFEKNRSSLSLLGNGPTEEFLIEAPKIFGPIQELKDKCEQIEKVSEQLETIQEEAMEELDTIENISNKLGIDELFTRAKEYHRYGNIKQLEKVRTELQQDFRKWEKKQKETEELRKEISTKEIDLHTKLDDYKKKSQTIQISSTIHKRIDKLFNLAKETNELENKKQALDLVDNNLSDLEKTINAEKLLIETRDNAKEDLANYSCRLSGYKDLSGLEDFSKQIETINEETSSIISNAESMDFRDIPSVIHNVIDKIEGSRTQLTRFLGNIEEEVEIRKKKLQDRLKILNSKISNKITLELQLRLEDVDQEENYSSSILALEKIEEDLLTALQTVSKQFSRKEINIWNAIISQLKLAENDEKILDEVITRVTEQFDINEEEAKLIIRRLVDQGLLQEKICIF